MTTNILDAFGEDGDLSYYNGQVGGGVTVSTTASTFRAGYARCSLMIVGATFGQRKWPSGPLTTGWFSYRVWVSSDFAQPNPQFFGFCDASGILRIVLGMASNGSNICTLSKVDAAGNLTLLFTTISGFSTTGPLIPDKVDFNFDYSTTGSITMWINGSEVGTYSGDITTDGMTQLAGVRLGSTSGFTNRLSAYSECILADGNTLDLSVVTCAPTGPGTTDQWTGAYTNVNQLTVDDANFDTTMTSGDVQLYTMSPISTGNFDILTLVTNIRASQGAGELSHIALTQEIGGTQYVTTAQNFPDSYGPVQFIQETNPATGVEWTQADVNSAGFQSGYQATT
jgi:hypothetical protein